MHIVTGEEMNDIDRCTINDTGLHGEMLMENAGRAVAHKLMDQFKRSEHMAVMIGAGNNGGDGFVVARVLLEAGYDVDVWLVPAEEKIKGDAYKHWQIFKAAGYAVTHYAENEEVFAQTMAQYTVIVDALLGTGVRGPARSPYKEVIAQLNASRAYTVSIDVPSGLPADGGALAGEAVQANRTITLQCPKTGAVVYPGAAYYGTWETVDIGIPQRILTRMVGARHMWRGEDVRRTLPGRTPSSHKGTHGKGLLIAGSETMTGAPVMAANAALRGGAGLLTTAVPDVIHPVVASQVVEATYVPCPSENGQFSGELPLQLGFDGIGIGPGVGRGEGGRHIVERLLQEVSSPLVVDADGLYALNRLQDVLRERQASTVLTPHPGEMAYLCGTSIQQVHNNRFQVSRQYAMNHGVYLVLKGPYTIVATPDGQQYVNTTGNAALAKGGTGDVLTGLILAFIMQHADLQAAVSNAVYLHGQAADALVAQDHSPIDVLATDVIAAFPQTLRCFISPEASSNQK